MSKALKLSSALVAAIAISGAGVALAEGNVVAQPGGVQQAGEAVQAPGAVDAMKSVAPVTGAPSAPALAPVAPVEMVSHEAPMAAMEAPKADGSIVDKMITHYNNKEVEQIVSMFADGDFVLVGHDGSVTKDAATLRKQLLDMFAGDKKYVYSAQVDNVKEVVPGLAVIAARYNIFEEGVTTPRAKMYGLTTVKYDSAMWKIIAQQTTEVNENGMVAGSEKQDSGIKLAIVAVIGAVLGYFISRFFPHKQA